MTGGYGPVTRADIDSGLLPKTTTNGYGELHSMCGSLSSVVSTLLQCGSISSGVKTCKGSYDAVMAVGSAGV